MGFDGWLLRICCKTVAALLLMMGAGWESGDAQQSENGGAAAMKAFEVASVRRAPDADPATGTWSLPNTNSFRATHVSLSLLMQLAYGVNKDQIANKPGWLEDDLFDVQARSENDVRLSREELRVPLQILLRERFHLRAHSETRTTQGFALLVAKGGAHLKPTSGAHFAGFRIHVGGGDMRGINWSMPQLARYLSDASGFVVADQTGITGSYDIDFTYNPDPDAANSTLPALDNALKQATGLSMRAEKVQTSMIVIDAVERSPTEN